MATNDTLADIPPMRSSRLRLAPLAPDDAATVAALTDDPVITQALSFLATPFTVDAAAELIARRAGGRDCFLGAWRAVDERLVGVVGTHLRGEAQLEIGYWFGTEFHGLGYASEAVVAVTGMLRHRLPHRVLVAECRPENRASWRVLVKAGFRPTGEAGTRPGRQLLSQAREPLSAPRGGEAG